MQSPRYKVLGTPIIIWALQLLYVAAALGLFVLLRALLHSQLSHLPAQIIYVFVVIIINVLWRLYIKMRLRAWF